MSCMQIEVNMNKNTTRNEYFRQRKLQFAMKDVFVNWANHLLQVIVSCGLLAS